jgi:hypothetical protein
MSWTNSLSGMPLVSANVQPVAGIPTVDTPIAVLVGLANHLVDLVISEFLADRSHNVTQLGRRDETVVIAVKDLRKVIRKIRVC